MPRKKASQRKRAIEIIETLEETLTANAKTIRIVGYIIQESIISWNCTMPEIFPEGHMIMQQYDHIGPPRDNMLGKEALGWLEKAIALTKHAKVYLNGLTDKEFKSAGLHIFRSTNPPVKILGDLKQYEDNKDKKLYKFLMKIAKEGELCSSIGCKLACAFCLRKILEEAIKKKILMDGGSIKDDGNPKRLKAMINQLENKLGHGLHREISARKFLMEEAIHSDHIPTVIELNNNKDTIFRVIEKIEVFDKKNGADDK